MKTAFPKKTKMKIESPPNLWVILYLAIILVVIYFTGWGMGKQYGLQLQLQDTVVTEKYAEHFCKLYGKRGVVIYSVGFDKSCGYVSYGRDDEASGKMGAIAIMMYDTFRRFCFTEFFTEQENTDDDTRDK